MFYRPGRVQKVPDALSRLTREQDDEQEACIDEEIPSFGDHLQVPPNQEATRQVAAAPSTGAAHAEPGARVRQQPNLNADHTGPDPEPLDLPPEKECLPRSKPLVRPHRVSSSPTTTTWNDTALVSLPDDSPEEDDAEDILVDVQDLVKERQLAGAPESYEVLPVPISKQEIIQEQKTDNFCQSVQKTQRCREGTPFFEDKDGMLCRRHPRDQTVIQAVLSSSLRHRLLRLAQHSPLAGHPGQTGLHRRLRRSYYWPHMAADVGAAVRECMPVGKNRLRLLRKASQMKLSLATAPLESVAIDILRPPAKSNRGYLFMLVISDHFTKLTQVVPLKRITAYDVAVVFVEKWVFKYGAPATMLSGNGSQFVAHFFRQVCNILQVQNIFTTTYHPQTNGHCALPGCQVERFNCTLAAMLLCYIEDNPDLCCLYAPALCYAYNMSVHSTTATPHFNLVLNRSPPEVTREHRPKSQARQEKRLRQTPARCAAESLGFVSALASALQTRL